MYNLFLAIKNEKELVFRGTLEEAVKREEALRKECRKSDPNGVELDCFVWSDEQIEKAKDTAKRWDALTEEQKKDIIEVDGKKYIRALYEANNR